MKKFENHVLNKLFETTILVNCELLDQLEHAIHQFNTVVDQHEPLQSATCNFKSVLSGQADVK